MPEPTLHPLEMILRQCAQDAPEPWYPSAYARENAVPRDSLDPYLDQLRTAGLIQLTEWVQGNGQGYRLTPEGRQLLNTPGDVAQLRAGKLLARPLPVEVVPETAGQEPTPWERGEAVRKALFLPGEAVLVRVLIFLTVVWFGVGLVLALKRDIRMSTYLGPIFTGLDERGREEQFRERRRLSDLYDELGAVSGSLFLRDGWWRLVSYAFVHGSLLHLAMNMFGLFALGRLAESMWGSMRFLILYLLGALGGSVLALLNDPSVGLIGASGSVCGLLTATSVWVALNREHLPPELLSLWTRNFLVNVLLVAFVSTMEGVSGAGHLGGAALGAVAGGLLNYHRFGSRWQRWLAAAALVGVSAGCVGFVYYTSAHDPRWQALRNDRPPRANAPDLRQVPLAQGRSAEEEADKLYRAVVHPLLVRQPGDRDPQAVREAVAALASSRTRLGGIGKTFQEEAAHFNEAPRKQDWLRCASYFFARAALADALARRLEKGPAWNGADALELEQKRALVLPYAPTWHKVKRTADPQAAPLPEHDNAPGGAIDAQPLPRP